MPSLPHDPLLADHKQIRDLAASVQKTVRDGADPTDAVKALQETVARHFRREDLYYAAVDQGKRFGDRGLMHQLRNDHAASLFALESLLIRLRKGGINDEWKTRLDNLLKVLLPHLDLEEKVLFAQATPLLADEDAKKLTSDIQNKA